MPSPAPVIVDGRDLNLDLNIGAVTPALRTCEARDLRACACVPRCYTMVIPHLIQSLSGADVIPARLIQSVMARAALSYYHGDPVIRNQSTRNPNLLSGTIILNLNP